jgi:RNA polymerase sigma factor (sigma-70 family)
MNYFEEAAAAVSAAFGKKKTSEGPAVRNLAAYLFRTFIRMVDEARRKQAALEKSVEEFAKDQVSVTDEGKTEIALLLDEVMATCDRASREVVVRRLEGFSSKEIGNQLCISEHAAEVRFSKALDHARKMLTIRRRKG